MTTANNARKAHKILDDLLKGNIVLDEEREFLRNALPELPKQMTLKELIALVYDVWVVTDGNEWPDDVYGDLETWLSELYVQLKGLKDATANTPAHPEFLETEADYENAPEGTIVACDDSPPWHKFDSTWLSTAAYESNSSKGMSTVIRRVLRWGNE